MCFRLAALDMPLKTPMRDSSSSESSYATEGTCLLDTYAFNPSSAYSLVILFSLPLIACLPAPLIGFIGALPFSGYLEESFIIMSILI